jgi:hypothetical protein
MNTAQALKELRKLLGLNAGIQDSKRPTSPELRERQRAARHAGQELKQAAQAAMEARRAEVLKGDTEYQRLLAEYTAARQALDKLPYGQHYRYSAGSTGRSGIAAMFFTVAAEGDTLEELIEKVKAKQQDAA